MILNFKVDGKDHKLNVNSDKPLNKILMDDLGNTSINSSCKNGSCGNCVVLLNSQVVLSCLTPAFKLNNSKVQTFDSFQNTRSYRDIQKAYQQVGRVPCPRCYAAKTLIIESIIKTLLMKDEINPTDKTKDKTKDKTIYENIDEKDEAFIFNELALNSCHCVESQELLKIVIKAFNYRRKRSVRKS